MSKSVAFIVNPVAGGVAVDRLLRSAAERLRAGGHQVRILPTQGPGDGETIARSLANTIDVLVAVGGDGTLREVIAGRLASPLPIAILPAGTENLVAKAYGYASDANSLARCLTNARLRMIDVGTVNGKVFTTVAGAGFDAEVVSRMVRRRRGHITHLDYFSPLWRTFWEHRFPVIRVFVDGRQVFDRRGLVMVGNIARYGAGLPILRDARDDDGLLDVCAYACSWQAPLLMHAAYTFAGRHRGRSSVTYAQGVRIRMESTSAVPLQTDGDAAGWLPADFTVIRGGAILCLPA